MFEVLGTLGRGVAAGEGSREITGEGGRAWTQHPFRHQKTSRRADGSTWCVEKRRNGWERGRCRRRGEEPRTVAGAVGS